MIRGTKKGVKRGNYKPCVLNEEQIRIIKKESLSYPYDKLAEIIDVEPMRLYGFLKRNNIPYLKSVKAHKGQCSDSEKRKLISSEEDKPNKIIIDRASFTHYSNKQHVY